MMGQAVGGPPTIRTIKAKTPGTVPAWLGADRVMVRFDDWICRGKATERVAKSMSIWANNSMMNIQAFGSERKTVMLKRAEARELFPFVSAEFTPINTITGTSGDRYLSYWVERKKKK